VRVLTFTSLFPSDARPRHGIFVETRLDHLVRDCGVDARVIAPVPWFPFSAPAFGAYARFAATPRRATRANGLQVAYPRYPMLPRIGVTFQPDAMARAGAADAERLRRSGWQPDLIDAHYLYPDGVAAAILARRLGVPFVMTARGTDVNVLACMPGPGRRIRWAAERAAAVIAVSSRLVDGLRELGVDPARMVCLRNGVDAALFHPEEQSAARGALGLPEGRIAACVGNLVPEKGFDLAIEALRHATDLHLAIVGDGPQRGSLAEQARRLGVDARVTFLPVMPQQALRTLYSACDVLLLTSTREGWPNVVLEAMACGTPVVATDVGAVGDMITGPAVGRIVPTRDALVLSTAVRDALRTPAPREHIRAHACRFDWRSISAAQFDLMKRAVAAGTASRDSAGMLERGATERP
jgi:glycosyltransferase involved in cell wall biosynthesis